MIFGCGLDLAGSGKDIEAGSCELSNAHGGSVKHEKSPEKLGDCQFLSMNSAVCG
jgi:hypothetical protein